MFTNYLKKQSEKFVPILQEKFNEYHTKVDHVLYDVAITELFSKKRDQVVYKTMGLFALLMPTVLILASLVNFAGNFILTWILFSGLVFPIFFFFIGMGYYDGLSRNTQNPYQTDNK